MPEKNSKCSQDMFLISLFTQRSRSFSPTKKRKLCFTDCSFSSHPWSSSLVKARRPIPGWIASGSPVPSVVTFSGTLMQWDITQLGSARRATAKARTQPLWIYHINKRPLPRGTTQKYIKLQHNSRSLLQVFCPFSLILEQRLGNLQFGDFSCQNIRYAYCEENCFKPIANNKTG